jgi:6-phosphofructokinase 1
MRATRPPSSRRAVAVLVDTGSSPAVEALLEALVRAATAFGWEVRGIEDGFEGLVRGRARRVPSGEPVGRWASGRLFASRPGVDPLAYLSGAGKKAVPADHTAEVRRHVRLLGLAGIVAIGGAETMAVAERLHRRDIPIVGVPVSVENDVVGTALTVGFDTAVAAAVEALLSLDARGEAGRGLLVAEVRGRRAGWLALHAGLSVRADVVLIPEIAFDPDRVGDRLRGRDGAVVVLAEGGRPQDGGAGGGAWLAGELARRLRRDAIHLPLQLLRGPLPSPSDRLLAVRLGTAAMRLVNEGLFGNMVALKPPVTTLPLHQVAGRHRPVPPDADVVRTARDLGIHLGE